MIRARTRPNCNAVMTTARLVGVGYEACPSCGSVFIGPEDAAEKDVDVGVLFGAGPGSGSALGRSTRHCPLHGQPMTSYRVVAPTGALTVERSDCCGGVFLDPGEESPLLAAAQRAARLAQMAQSAPPAASDSSANEFVVTASGARFAAPPPTTEGAFGNALRGLSNMGAQPPSPEHLRRIEASSPSEHSCPRCGTAYRQDESDGIVVELCPDCGSMFLDAQDTKAKELPTALLFGVSEHAAKGCGPSKLSCPRCDEPMTVFEVPFITGPIEVDRATCCGGLFLDGGEYEPLLRASRVAQGRAADAQYAKQGSFVGEAQMDRAMRDGNTKILEDRMRRTVDAMVARNIARQEARRQARHHHHRHHHRGGEGGDD